MRTFFTILLLCICSTFLLATHNRAGEITYEQTGPRTVKATIITYTKTSAVQTDRDSLTICWGDGVCETILRNTPDGESIRYDFTVNQYTNIHTYPNEGQYNISMTDPNRNGGILNVNAPESDRIQFHLQSSITILPSLDLRTNQSPKLLVPPIDLGFVRQRFMHTPNAIDSDGDSIAYELVSPLMENDMPVPNYVQVDKIGAGVDNTYSFDEKTGLFVWNSPQIVGQYNIAIKVKAYRDDELIDMIVRDMQILIQAEYNLPPALEIQNFIPSTIEIAAGKMVNFNFFGIDIEDELSDLRLDLSLISEVLELGAAVAYQTNQGTLVGNFTWTPTTANIRSIPYQVTLKAVDSKGAAAFKVVTIKVSSFSTAISEEFKGAGYKLFPNPTVGASYLKIPNKALNQPAILSIFDNLGRLVKMHKIDQLTTLNPLPTTELSKGNYIIQLVSKEINVSTSLVVH